MSNLSQIVYSFTQKNVLCLHCAGHCVMCSIVARFSKTVCRLLFLTKYKNNAGESGKKA